MVLQTLPKTVLRMSIRSSSEKSLGEFLMLSVAMTINTAFLKLFKGSFLVTATCTSISLAWKAFCGKREKS